MKGIIRERCPKCGGYITIIDEVEALCDRCGNHWDAGSFRVTEEGQFLDFKPDTGDI